MLGAHLGNPPRAHVPAAILVAVSSLVRAENEPRTRAVMEASSTFKDASREVIDYLSEHVPLGMWTVSRYDGTDQVYLDIEDDVYGLETGDSVPWEDTFCIHGTQGRAPQLAPDAMSDPVYSGLEVSKELEIGSYVGIPLQWSDGTLFGTLCGMDPMAGAGGLGDQESLLRLLAKLLSGILQTDHVHELTLRAAEQELAQADLDGLTGLPNRRA